MKTKCLFAGFLAAVLLLAYPLSTIADATEAKLEINPALAEYHLETYVCADENGSLPLPEDGSLLNICFPTKLGGQTIDTIAPGGFRGCSYFRSVFLPAQIVNIGANAFADCAGLEYIVLMGRYNTDGMVLGDNWSGNATVVFGLIQKEAEEATEPTEATVPAESTEATNPTEETTPAESTEATNPTEETTPAESTEATDPTEETTPAESTEATDPTEETTPAESTEATEPGTEETKPAEQSAKPAAETIPVTEPTENPAETVSE